MRQARAVLATVGVGCLFHAVFWLLLGLSLPHAALAVTAAPVELPVRPTGLGQLYSIAPPAPTPAPAPGGSPELPPLVLPGEDDSTGVAFGPIAIITGGAALEGKDPAPNAAYARSAMLAGSLAQAMDIDPANLEAAELMCAGSLCTDPAGAAVLGLAPGTWFPTRGTSFALLSTGTITGRPAGDMDVGANPSMNASAGRAALVAGTGYTTAAELLQGLKNDEHGDLVRLRLRLTPPLTATCFALDFTFYTVDLPYTDTAAVAAPAVTTSANHAKTAGAFTSGDLFTAQYDAADLHIEDDGRATVPGNIAFNWSGQVVASSTMSPADIYAALEGPAGVNVPGAFPLLQMRSPVTGGKPFDLVLSIQDRGDAFGDSAVALDNFAWLVETDRSACNPTSGHRGDRDGDGLPDGWEQHGVYAEDGAGVLQHLDLPAWGADPDIKDVFVEIDAMLPFSDDGYDPTPHPNAIARIVDAFARAPVDQVGEPAPKQLPRHKGIRLHVDYGSNAPLMWAPVAAGSVPTWDTASGGGMLAEPPLQQLCGEECADSLDPLWATIDRIKRDNFSSARARVFHYALFAHELAPCTVPMIQVSGIDCWDNEQISGISRNLLPTEHGASDFVVSLGAAYWSESYTQTELPQAGTFMHELGHNLGLNHFGTIESRDAERLKHKPNHLSVMNYLYQTDGLVVSAPMFMFDYSRYNMAPLYETALDERAGIKLAQSGIVLTYTLGVRRYCQTTDVTVTLNAETVDWNCVNGEETVPVTHSINGDAEIVSGMPIYSRLAALNEWEQLVFTGGMLNRQRSMLQPVITVRIPLFQVAGEQKQPQAACTAGL